jgi:hypothetical protein
MIINFGIHPIWEDRYEIITNTLDKNGMLEWGQNGGIIFLRFDTVWAGRSHSATLIFAYCRRLLSSISGDGFESE